MKCYFVFKAYMCTRRDALLHGAVVSGGEIGSYTYLTVARPREEHRTLHLLHISVVATFSIKHKPESNIRQIKRCRVRGNLTMTQSTFQKFELLLCMFERALTNKVTRNETSART